MTWNQFDDRVRTMMDEFFTPTQKRVLELQEKMGELARIYAD